HIDGIGRLTEHSGIPACVTERRTEEQPGNVVRVNPMYSAVRNWISGEIVHQATVRSGGRGALTHHIHWSIGISRERPDCIRTREERPIERELAISVEATELRRSPNLAAVIPPSRADLPPTS